MLQLFIHPLFITLSLPLFISVSILNFRFCLWGFLCPVFVVYILQLMISDGLRWLVFLWRWWFIFGGSLMPESYLKCCPENLCLPQLVIRSLQSWPRGFGATLSCEAQHQKPLSTHLGCVNSWGGCSSHSAKTKGQNGQAPSTGQVFIFFSALGMLPFGPRFMCVLVVRGLQPNLPSCLSPRLLIGGPSPSQPSREWETPGNLPWLT